MDNFVGARIANYVLNECKKNGLFECKSKDFIADFLVKLTKNLKKDFDCHSETVLKELNEEFGICVTCYERKNNLDQYNRCKECDEYYKRWAKEIK